MGACFPAARVGGEELTMVCAQYSVVVYPSETTAFVPNTYDSLRIESVQIATAYAPGPRPRVLSPPGYVTSLRSRPGGLYHTRSAIL